jgi:hypothetical protein
MNTQKQPMLTVIDKQKRKYVRKEKSIDYLTIKKIVGRVADTSKLTPPYFEDATKREPEISPFKRRMMELFKPTK